VPSDADLMIASCLFICVLSCPCSALCSGLTPTCWALLAAVVEAVAARVHRMHCRGVGTPCVHYGWNCVVKFIHDTGRFDNRCKMLGTAFQLFISDGLWFTLASRCLSPTRRSLLISDSLWFTLASRCLSSTRSLFISDSFRFTLTSRCFSSTGL